MTYCQVLEYVAFYVIDTVDLKRTFPKPECLLQATRGRGGLSAKADAVDVSVVEDTSAVRLVLGACASALLNTEVPANAPLMSVGLDSIAAVEFTNAVSDELETSVSAMVLFDHPTLDSIASYLASELELELELGAATVARSVSTILGSSFLGSPMNRQVLLYIASACFQVTGATNSEAALQQLVSRAYATPSSIPLTRWEMSTEVAASAAYGSFLEIEDLTLDGGAFGISALEARSMDPQQSFVLHAGYAALVYGSNNAQIVRDGLVYSSVGVFVGVEPSG